MYQIGTVLCVSFLIFGILFVTVGLDLKAKFKAVPIFLGGGRDIKNLYFRKSHFALYRLGKFPEDTLNGVAVGQVSLNLKML